MYFWLCRNPQGCTITKSPMTTDSTFRGGMMRNDSADTLLLKVNAKTQIITTIIDKSDCKNKNHTLHEKTKYLSDGKA